MSRPRTSLRTIRRCVEIVVGVCLLDRRNPAKVIREAVRESLVRRKAGAR